MIRMLMLLGASVVPMIVTASIIDGQNKAAQGFNASMTRRSQNIEIASDLLVDTRAYPQQITLHPVVSEPSSQLVIDSCGGQISNANFRSAPRMISQDVQSDPFIQSVIPSQSVVELTGQSSGEWIEVRWNGTAGYIHRCWQ